MEHSQQTIQQIERAIDKIVAKFQQEETMLFTDIHLRVIQESGEFLAYDDDDNEINRCVIDEWIDNKDDDFYHQVSLILQQRLSLHSERIENMCISKPFSFVLEDDEHEVLSELYLVDDDLIIIGGDLMEGLDSDLDSFFSNLMDE